jgi:hypothetical protein
MTANFTYKRNSRRHWENVVQNIQREHNQSRRNAHRLLQHYNANTECWRRRYAGCVNQARKVNIDTLKPNFKILKINSKMLRISLII